MNIITLIDINLSIPGKHYNTAVYKLLLVRHWNVHHCLSIFMLNGSWVVTSKLFTCDSCFVWDEQLSALLQTATRKHIYLRTYMLCTSGNLGVTMVACWAINLMSHWKMVFVPSWGMLKAYMAELCSMSLKSTKLVPNCEYLT